MDNIAHLINNFKSINTNNYIITLIRRQKIPRHYLIFENWMVLICTKNLSPFTQECFVPSLVEIGPVVLEKKMKMWKVYRQTDGHTDRLTDRQQMIGDQKRAHLSFQLRWAKKAALEVGQYKEQFLDHIRYINPKINSE